VSDSDEVTAAVYSALGRLTGLRERPSATSELVADLGLDSIRVIEFIADMEDRFDILVPLNDLPAAITVAEVIAMINRLVASRSST
jgi:acyl carrier protein